MGKKKKKEKIFIKKTTRNLHTHKTQKIVSLYT